MSKSNLLKWRHYEANIILLCVRWYLTYPLSYRQVAEMVNERGMKVSHTTILRWVQQYGPELDKRCRPYLRSTNDSWRVDETYIKVLGKPKYLDRAVASAGNTLDFLLTALARCCCCQTLLPQDIESGSHSGSQSYHCR
jgi:transposase-like protein